MRGIMIGFASIPYTIRAAVILFATEVLLCDTGISAGNERVKSFRAAKKLLPGIFSGQETTFYCGCRYSGKDVSHEKCGYAPRKARTSKGKVNRRAHRLEWEHVVPAHAFGQSFEEWRTPANFRKCLSSNRKPISGRRCAKKLSIEFRMMESDLFNLRPAIGEVNGLRSNYSMAMLEGEVRDFGKCDVEIRNRKIEPRTDIRGDIARTYQYMNCVYPGRGIISSKNRKTFDAWSVEDPVSEQEIRWARKVSAVQGNCNPFVQKDCPLRCGKSRKKKKE